MSLKVECQSNMNVTQNTKIFEKVVNPKTSKSASIKNLRIGIGIIFIIWKVITNYLQIPEIYIFSYFFSDIPFSQLLYVFHLKNLLGKQSHSEIYVYSLYILDMKIRYS